MSMPGPIEVTLRRDPESDRGSIELKGPKKESSDTYRFHLPWRDPIEWQAVFLSLELQEEDPETWPKGDVRKKAQELDLFLQDQGRPSNDRFEIIGQALYKTVFNSEKISPLLDSLLNAESDPVLEFHIQDEGSRLQAYPWELLHNGKEFLFEGNRAFPVRHIDFEKSITQFNLTQVLRVLYVAPRPNISSHEDYANLPVLERLYLEYLKHCYPDHLALEIPLSNTLDALQRYLGSKNPVQVVHIDTHGSFGWLCQCKQLNPPNAKQCSKCDNPRSSDQRNRGYLAFEATDGDVDWVSGDNLGKRLHRKGVQVVVLSACRSGLVGGKSTFNSVAGALGRQRIPAVVAMQFSVEVNQAEKFAEFFYWALMNGLPLTKAVAEGRIALKDSWYRPVLYLRTDSSNYQGEIFKPKSPLGPPKKLGPREKWIARLGFERDPFLYLDGGADPFLQKYFYFDMKHFYDIQADVSKPGTIFVFGPPGSGKSSLRNVISQLGAKDNILPIVYQDFGPLVYKDSKKVQVEDHVTQILKIALRTLADLAKESNKKDKSSPKIKKNKIIRNQLWLYVSEYEDDPFRKQALENLLKPKPKAKGTLPTDARELLGRFCRYVTALFGYQFVYILVDPSNDIDSDEEIAWKVLKPLLSTQRLLELAEDKVAFKFFLNQKFREQALQEVAWIEQEQNKRVYKIEWPDEERRALLQERLEQCSGGRYRSLGELSEVDNLDDRVIRLSMGSPRELIVICDRLFSEHCRKWSPDDGEPLLITAQEMDEVLKPFEEQYPKSELEQLIAQGESDQIEFKSTMRYHVYKQQKDSEMEREIARTLCAFMNTEGGTLIIGVKDDGTVLGLDDDFSTLGRRKNKDGFEQAFVNITENLFASPVSPDDYTARFEECQGKLVYVVEMKKSEKPVFCLFDGVKEFYIRKQTTTRKLDSKDTWDYGLDHFKN